MTMGVGPNSCEGRELSSSVPVGDQPIAQRLRAEYLMTSREADCLVQALGGKSSSQIGSVLGISSSTVRTYLVRSYDRMGVSSLEEAKSLISMGMGADSGPHPNVIPISEPVWKRMVAFLAEVPYVRLSSASIILVTILALMFESSAFATHALALAIVMLFLIAFSLVFGCDDGIHQLRTRSVANPYMTVLMGAVLAAVFMGLVHGGEHVHFPFIFIPPLLICLVCALLIPIFMCDDERFTLTDSFVLVSGHAVFIIVSFLSDQSLILFFSALVAVCLLGMKTIDTPHGPMRFFNLPLMVGGALAWVLAYVAVLFAASRFPIYMDLQDTSEVVRIAVVVYGIGGFLLVTCVAFFLPIATFSMADNGLAANDLCVHYLTGRGLTSLEVSTAIGLIRGRSLSQLSRELGYSASSIGAARTSLFIKLSVASREELSDLLARETPCHEDSDRK